MRKLILPFTLTFVLGTGAASAATITISATAWPGGLTPAFGALVDDVGTFYVPQGFDFTAGNVEGVFNDGGGVLAFCGINGAGNCDLLTAVDASFLNLVDSIFVEAGFASENALLLEVFDSGLNLLASATLTNPTGPNGRFTATINRGGLFDIAYFRVSGADTFGVNTITVTNSVPEPATLLLLGSGLAAAGLRRRRKA
jgi:hypothetical protein